MPQDDMDLARSTVESARRLGATFADLRLIRQHATNLLVQDGRADRLQSSQGVGAGIRVLVEGCWGFAASERVDGNALRTALEEAVAAAKATIPHATEQGVVADVECSRDITFSVGVPNKIDTRPQCWYLTTSIHIDLMTSITLTS